MESRASPINGAARGRTRHIVFAFPISPFVDVRGKDRLLFPLFLRGLHRLKTNKQKTNIQKGGQYKSSPKVSQKLLESHLVSLRKPPYYNRMNRNSTAQLRFQLNARLLIFNLFITPFLIIKDNVIVINMTSTYTRKKQISNPSPQLLGHDNLLNSKQRNTST